MNSKNLGWDLAKQPHYWGSTLSQNEIKSKSSYSESTYQDTKLIQNSDPPSNIRHKNLSEEDSSDSSEMEEPSKDAIFFDVLNPKAVPKFMNDLEVHRASFSTQPSAGTFLKSPFQSLPAQKSAIGQTSLPFDIKEADSATSQPRLSRVKIRDDLNHVDRFDANDFHKRMSKSSTSGTVGINVQGFSRNSINRAKRNSKTPEEEKSQIERQTSPLNRYSVINTLVEVKPRTSALSGLASIFSRKAKPENTSLNVPIKLTRDQYDLINDKVYVTGHMLRQKSLKRTRSKKELPKLKQLLQKHHIVRSNVQTDFVRRIISIIKMKKEGRFFRVKRKAIYS